MFSTFVSFLRKRFPRPKVTGNNRWHLFCLEWKDLARRLSLDFGPGEKPGLVKMHGKSGDYHVVVDTWIDKSLTIPVVEVTRFQVFTFDLVPRNLHIERLEPSYKRTKSGPPRILTGDREFDETIRVHGDETIVRALLDAPTRSLVAESILKLGFIVHDSSIYVSESGHVDDVQRIDARVTQLKALAGRLTLLPSAVGDKLLSTARREPITTVRQRTFHLLFAHFSTHEAVKRMLGEILRDRDPLIRLLAAESQGDAGLVRVEAMAVDTSIPDEVRVIAYCYLVQWAAQKPDVLSLLARAIEEETPRIALTIIQFAATVRARPLTPWIAARFTKSIDQSLLKICIETLAALGAPEAEDILLPVLYWTDPILRLAAVAGLEKVGTIRSIELLLPLAQGLLVETALKDSAKRSLAAVRSRLEGAESGCLSLVEGEDRRGALSVKIGEDGALSLQTAEGGALSIRTGDPPC